MTDAADPIDLTHLGQYTGGDQRLEDELFQLFLQQIETVLGRLDGLVQAPGCTAWREAAHSLRGAAAGIGAFAVAESAGSAERMDPGKDKASAETCLAQLRERCDVAKAFIGAYLGRQKREPGADSAGS